jgi:hypothetical protein
MLNISTQLQQYQEFTRLISFIKTPGRCLGWVVCPSKELENIILDTLIITTGMRIGSFLIPNGTRDFYDFLANVPNKSRNCIFLSGCEDSIIRKYQNLNRLNNPLDYQCAINLQNHYADIPRRFQSPVVLITGTESEAILSSEAPNFVDYCGSTKFSFHLVEKDGKLHLSPFKDGKIGEWCDSCQTYH